MPTDLPTDPRSGRPSPAGTTEPSRATFGLAAVAAVLAGAALAVQSLLNGRLAQGLGGMPAAAWSFGSGLAVLSLLLVDRRSRARVALVAAAVRGHGLRWWHVLGGVTGGLLVSTQTYAVPLVGVAAFLVAIVAGQTISALLVDRLGLGPAPAQRLSVARVVAAGAAVAGVALATAPGEDTERLVLWPVVLAFGVGLGVAVQQAFNGRVNAVSGSALVTTWLNFLVGTVTILVVGGAALLWRSRPPVEGAPWWAWWGGISGIVIIVCSAWAVQHTGVLVFGLITVTSQLSLALAIDLVNPATRDQVDAQVLLGVAVTMLAAVAASLARARQRPRAGRTGGPGVS